MSKPLEHDASERCSFCHRPLLEYPYCRCDYLGFTRTEAERRRQRIRSAIGMPESGRAKQVEVCASLLEPVIQAPSRQQ